MTDNLELSRLHRRLERQHRQLRKDLEKGPFDWIVPRFVSGSVFGIGLTLVLPGFLGGGLGIVDASSVAFWVKLLGPVVVAGLLTPYMYLKSRQQSQRPVGEMVRKSESEIESLTAPGWVGRVLRRGALPHSNQ